MRFEGKVVLVTGAGSGIGRHLCEAFAAEGAAIASADLDAQAARETTLGLAGPSSRHGFFQLDVADETSVEAAVRQVIARLGRIDVLINNAGIAYGDIYQLTSIPSPRLMRLLEVNVVGVLHCARACRAALSESGGVILNMSSMASYMANGAYSLTKAAVNNLTLTLADELAGDGIRVNGLAPGLIDSPAAMAQVNAVFQRRIHAAQLVKRQGRMGDVAGLAMFLASESASFITGQTVLVDGGFLRHSSQAMPVPVSGLPNE